MMQPASLEEDVKIDKGSFHILLCGRNVWSTPRPVNEAEKLGGCKKARGEGKRGIYPVSNPFKGGLGV